MSRRARRPPRVVWVEFDHDGAIVDALLTPFGESDGTTWVKYVVAPKVQTTRERELITAVLQWARGNRALFGEVASVRLAEAVRRVEGERKRRRRSHSGRSIFGTRDGWRPK